MGLVSSVYRWGGKPFRIEPVGLVAARANIKHLSSRPELSKTVEALRCYNGGLVIGIRHSRKHRVK